MSKGNDYTITAVKKAIGVLKLFEKNNNGLALSEISALSGIGKSSVLRILYTLENEGFVSYNDETKKYRLGIELFRLGSAVDNSLDIRHIARKHMRKLCNATEMMSYLGTRQGDYLLMLERVLPASIPLWSQLTIQNGGVMNLYSSGIGRLFLAQESDEEIMKYLDRVNIEKFTDETITDKEEILSIIKEARRTGISGNIGENEPHVYSVCAPVLDNEGHMVAGISLCGLKDVFYNEDHEKYIDMLKKTVADVSHDIGYTVNKSRL